MITFINLSDPTDQYVRTFLFLVFSRYLFAALLTMLTMALYLQYKDKQRKISRRRYTVKMTLRT